MSLQVLHIIDHLGIGGAQGFLCDLVLSQKKNARITPVVCCLGGQTILGAEVEKAGVSLHYLRTGRRQPWRLAFLLPKLYRLLKQTSPDVVHTHLFVSGVVGRVASLLGGVPTVVHEQCNESTLAPWWKRKFDSLLARRTGAVICVSNSTARFNVREKGVSANKIHTIPNGMDLERALSSPAPQDALIELVDLPSGALVVTGIGRLVQQKRFDLFLQIASRVSKVRTDTIFLMAGDGPERSRLEADAANSGLTSIVRFLGARNDIGSLLALTDIFVLMSDFEGLPLILLEAMAAGVCVVATEVDGCQELLAGTGAAVLVPAGDVLAASEAVLTLLDNRERREKIAVAGRDFVFKHCGIDATAAKIETVYNLVLDDSARTR